MGFTDRNRTRATQWNNKRRKKSIAHTLQKEVGSEQAKANANLIAAAPELLEALIEIRKLVSHHDKADLAIKKALGEEK